MGAEISLINPSTPIHTLSYPSLNQPGLWFRYSSEESRIVVRLAWAQFHGDGYFELFITPYRNTHPWAWLYCLT
jgi:hypothetical protein